MCWLLAAGLLWLLSIVRCLLMVVWCLRLERQVLQWLKFDCSILLGLQEATSVFYWLQKFMVGVATVCECSKWFCCVVFYDAWGYFCEQTLWLCIFYLRMLLGAIFNLCIVLTADFRFCYFYNYRFLTNLNMNVTKARCIWLTLFTLVWWYICIQAL